MTEAARATLLRRCVQAWDGEGAPIDADALPASVLAEAADGLALLHEAAEISVSLACPACASVY